MKKTKIIGICVMLAMMLAVIILCISGCGKAEPSEGLEFELNDDGRSYSVVGIGTCKDTNIVIPAEYNDLPVTSIGYSAFEDCENLTSIEIPSSVTSIGEYAFRFCSSLTSVTFGENSKLTSIGDYAFSGCSNLTNIEIPSSVTSIGNSTFEGCLSLTSIEIPSSVTSIGKYAFLDCSSLTSIEIPSSVTSIGGGAFWGCSSLTSVILGENRKLTSIGDYAFLYCSSLTSIEIPSSVTSIGEWAFGGCSSLESIVVSEGNIVYHSAGNCLIKTASKTLVVGCKNSVIPTDGSVTSVGGGAFWVCSNLTSIEIPSSVTSIGDNAFSYCESLTSITYKGTKAQWNQIEKGIRWDEDTGNYTIHCTDGDIEK